MSRSTGALVDHWLYPKNGRQSAPKDALTWAPKGKRKCGRSKETWRRTVEKERGALRFKSWRKVAVVARDRVVWSKRFSSLFPPLPHGIRKYAMGQKKYCGSFYLIKVAIQQKEKIPERFGDEAGTT